MWCFPELKQIYKKFDSNDSLYLCVHKSRSIFHFLLCLECSYSLGALILTQCSTKTNRYELTNKSSIVKTLLLVKHHILPHILPKKKFESSKSLQEILVPTSKEGIVLESFLFDKSQILMTLSRPELKRNSNYRTHHEVTMMVQW